MLVPLPLLMLLYPRQAQVAIGGMEASGHRRYYLSRRWGLSAVIGSGPQREGRKTACGLTCTSDLLRPGAVAPPHINLQRPSRV